MYREIDIILSKIVLLAIALKIRIEILTKACSFYEK